MVCGGSGSHIHVVFVKLKDSLEQLADVLIRREYIPPNNFTVLHSQFGILNLECFVKELSLFYYICSPMHRCLLAFTRIHDHQTKGQLSPHN